MVVSFVFFFFFKQKTAYEMRISDWSSDVCSSDLFDLSGMFQLGLKPDHVPERAQRIVLPKLHHGMGPTPGAGVIQSNRLHGAIAQRVHPARRHYLYGHAALDIRRVLFPLLELSLRSEENTSELQSLTPISYA